MIKNEILKLFPEPIFKYKFTDYLDFNKELSKYIDKLKRAELGLSEEFKEKINCPFCGSKVYDNRDTKFNDSAPDFVCSNNNKDKCSGHTGKFKKGWWVDSKDIPSEWYIKY